MNKRTSTTRAFNAERWLEVQLVHVGNEPDGARPTKCRLRPYFNRPPAHSWCHHFAMICEADAALGWWRDGSAYCTADQTDDVKRAFAQHTGETNAWFRRHLARMVAERPLYAQRLLDAERVRASESDHDRKRAHPYPAV
jgi:hypothetical protein